MNPELMLYPMIALILFTGAVGVAMLRARLKAVRQGELNPSYFKYNRGGKPPEYLTKITQHFHNLLETPPLFFLALITVFVTERADYIHLTLAWLYVAARLAHARVHLGSNHIVYRKNIFLISYVLLFSIWFRLLFQLLTG